MKGGGFLTVADRKVLLELARDGLAEHRLARRANALILLDRGMSCAEVARVLLLDDDTIRRWRELFGQDGVEGLAGFHFGGRQPFLAEAQEEQLRAWVGEHLPRTTRDVGAWIEGQFGVVFESRSGLIKLLHRLGFEHRKPAALACKMDPDKQRRFIAQYESLLNHLPPDETVMFIDAVHPVYGAKPVGCWAPKGAAVAVEQTTGREHLNIHGAIDLETGTTEMLLVERVDTQSTIALLEAIEGCFPRQRRIHVFADQARCHRAKLIWQWLRRPGCRIRLHLLPPYCPHLNPIERLWGAMHKAITHNRCSTSFRAFQTEVLIFLRRTVPQNWNAFCDAITDNFRVREPAQFRILK
jgi:transposase